MFTQGKIKELKSIQILTQNTKMKKTSKENKIRLFNFGITAYKSYSTGKITCPFAKDCVKYCYAKKGAYVWRNVKASYEMRYLLTKQPELFIEKMSTAILDRKATHIRIHDSGDFYNYEYIKAWFKIINKFPKVKFYAYTKSKKLFDVVAGLVPKNLQLIYSLGSKFDNLIDQENDRHSKLFNSEEELISAGYVNASNNDLLAITKNKKVGLLKH
tara:strand:+ start:403 stop:1047 length:645 start_codon:yes stop_codon:yes gene_type:complete